MSAPASSKISRERLNQIALRKLTTFGIATAPDPSGQRLLGEWPFRGGKVMAPGTQVRIASARFQVEGHDLVRFLAPPLSALEPLSFYDASSADELELRVARALSVRMRYLQALAGQLAERRIQVRLDGNALLLRAEVETTEHIFELEADPNGVRMVKMRGLHSGAPPTPISLAVRLEDHPTRSDLELFLANAADRGELGRTATPDAEPSGAELHLLPPSPGELTTKLLQRFGPQASLGVRDGRLEVTQALRVGGEGHRFEAVHLSGSTFQGRLFGEGREKWADRFDLNRFPGVEELARICLSLPKPEALRPASAAEAASSQASAGPAGALPPVAGERWVMSVLVERESEGEIRYTCADLDGHPYGATRVLAARDFRETFSPHGAGWRLRIEIARLEGDAVVYRQLNPAGARGPEKRLPLATMMTVFLPEAQAY